MQKFREQLRDKIFSLNLFLKSKKVRYLSIVGLLSKVLFINFKEGFSIFSEHWDNLLILDACRFDFFSAEIQRRQISGNLSYKLSRGSMTEEFLIKNFTENYYSNIVYVTANPFVDLVLKEKVYKIIPVWKYAWDKYLKTVPPYKVCKFALKAKKKYPDKKIIIHFMQPHYPFIGFSFKKETGISEMVSAINNKNRCWMDIDIWDLFFDGAITIEDIISGYKQNLKIVMNAVEDLIKNLDGKIVITSDHGEAFGEKLHRLVPLKVYGHPRRVKIKSLIKVPWFVIFKEKNLKHLKTVSRIRRVTSRFPV